MKKKKRIEERPILGVGWFQWGKNGRPSGHETIIKKRKAERNTDQIFHNNWGKKKKKKGGGKIGERNHGNKGSVDEERERGGRWNLIRG